MKKIDISTIYDTKFIDHYDRFVNAYIQIDRKERSMLAMSVLLSSCGLISQIKEPNKDVNLVLMSSVFIMTGLYTMYRINRILEHTRFIRF